MSQDSSGSGVLRAELDVCSQPGDARLVQSGHLCVLPDTFIGDMRLYAVQLPHQRLSRDMMHVILFTQHFFYSLYSFIYVSAVFVLLSSYLMLMLVVQGVAPFCFEMFSFFHCSTNPF